MRLFKRLWFALLAASILAAPGVSMAAAEVNIYSARVEALIKPLLDRFSEETGIKVNLVTGKADELLNRLRHEGRNSPADILLTVDAGNLHRAKEMGVIQAFRSEALEGRIPSQYRDADGYWYGLSLRARPIMYAKGRVDPATLSSYEGITDPRWRGKICIRSSGNIYNQSMVSSMIATNGEQATEAWARGLVANLARPPRGGDRDQIKAVASGQCDIAIANTYYLVGMLKSNDPTDREVAQQIGVFWPNQQDRGVHMNVSGAALTQAARNKDNAIRLIEFLSTEASQQWYAEANGEYPVRADVPVGEILNGWGEFKADPIDMGKLGEFSPQALRLMDRAGWQ
ncbi:MAG: Fe(3+) ABC transporter substrate-binding protein [Chromatiales bacterium]|nr:Fe(3+) ABC transporter substrate-binding protein [Gammaproteobacteria bacterium]MBW6476728.1 Fe(3+) ABC transporter substrate-binding protein [Chromatiales bacterium]